MIFSLDPDIGYIRFSNAGSRYPARYQVVLDSGYFQIFCQIFIPPRMTAKNPTNLVVQLGTISLTSVSKKIEMFQLQLSRVPDFRLMGKILTRHEKVTQIVQGGHFDRFQIGQICTAKLYNWLFLIFRVRSNLMGQLGAKCPHDITDIDFIEKY